MLPKIMNEEEQDMIKEGETEDSVWFLFTGNCPGNPNLVTMYQPPLLAFKSATAQIVLQILGLHKSSIIP